MIRFQQRVRTKGRDRRGRTEYHFIRTLRTGKRVAPPRHPPARGTNVFIVSEIDARSPRRHNAALQLSMFPCLYLISVKLHSSDRRVHAPPVPPQ